MSEILGGENQDIEESMENLMENLGLQELLQDIEGFFQGMKPMIEEFFASIGITDIFDDEQNNSAQNSGSLPEELDSQSLRSSQEHASTLQNILASHSELIGAVLNLQGNIGDSPTAIAMVSNLDLNRPVEIIYHFHGKNSQDPSSTDRFDETLSALESSGRNAILVYPINRNQEEYDRGWMNGEGDNGDFDNMHASVLDYFDTNGMHLSNFTVTVEGHSAGGQPLRNIARSGSTVADRIVYLDASYGGNDETNWARACYDAARGNYDAVDRDFEMQILFISASESDWDGGITDNEGTRSLVGADGVTHIVLNPGDGMERISHGGAIPFGFGGVDLSDPEIQRRILNP